MTAAPIEFYFDFSSPYAYFASHEVDALAARHGRRVDWRPILLGPVFQTSGNTPLMHQPLKGEYVRRDWLRISRLTGIPYALPATFPVGTIAAARAFYVLADDDPELAVRFARAVFAAYFAQGRDITDRELVVGLAAELGADPRFLAAAIEEPEAKQRLKDEVDQALARGVCGAPFLLIDGEPFWGWDRLGMAEEWLSRGGW